jgi:hypothetical protein
VSLLADHMAAFILGALGLSYLIAVILVSYRPARWRLTMWLTQIIGFSGTCFVMERIGLMRPLDESAGLAVAGAGLGALAAWRWDGVAETIRDLALAARRARRQNIR